MVEVRWHGRGGQGSFTAARLLGVAASIYGDSFAQAFPSFGPERRGAPVLGFNRIDDKKIGDRSEVNECDYAVVLDDTLWGDAVLKGLKKDSVIIINTSTPEKFADVDYKVITIDATAMALELLGRPINNTAMMGALAATGGFVKPEQCIKAIESMMKASIAQKNINLFNAAFKYVQEGSK